MPYIAIKNTEHKGVYKEKEFNKELYTTKNMSYRKFKDNELEAALKWAGVKDIKSASTGETTSNKKKKKENTTKNNTTTVLTKQEINTAYDAIMNYKKKGVYAVSVHTKNYGEILLRLNSYYIFVCKDDSSRYFQFDAEKESLSSYMQSEMEKAFAEKDSNYRTRNLCYYCFSSNYSSHNFELLTFNNLSKIESINSDYIGLDNFWSIQNSKLGNQYINFNCFFSSRYNKDKLLETHHDVYLNISDITSIQPLYFSKDSAQREYTTYSSKAVVISKSEFNEIKNMFEKYNAKNIAYTVFDKQECD